MAGVPRASLVVITTTLNQFLVPEAGLLLILDVDTFLDMGRSATSAIGNSVASSVVAKWEGGLLSEEAITHGTFDAEKERPLPPEGLPATT
jgi:Na+/H+-dicarboxylate symporter